MTTGFGSGNPIVECDGCGRRMTNNLISRHARTHEPGHMESRRARKAVRQRAYHKTVMGQAVAYRTRHSARGRAANLRAVHKIRATEEGQVRLRARLLAYRMVKTGAIPRGPCVVCQSPKSTIHHPNGYHGDAALIITFLCWRHHMEAHGRVSA